MKDRTIIGWDPSQWSDELSELRSSHPDAKGNFVPKVNEAIDGAFTPIEWAFYDRLKATKISLLDTPRMLGCAINLNKNGRFPSYLEGKHLCADVTFLPLNLLRMPVDNQVVGPVAVEAFRIAVDAFDKAGSFPTATARDVLSEFEENNYCYTWTIKDAAIRRMDFRVKMDISRSYERTIGTLTISSVKKGISEAFEVYNEPRAHPLEYCPEIPRDEAEVMERLNKTVSFWDLAHITVDSRGFHIAPTFQSHITKFAADLGSEENPPSQIYHISLTSKDLPSTICNSLKII